MISQIRSRIKPEVQNPPQASRTELLRVALVYEADHRHILIVERPEQPLCHGAHAGKISRTAVTAAGQVINRDGHFASRSKGGRDE
jgi:hypothetical protein